MYKRQAQGSAHLARRALACYLVGANLVHHHAMDIPEDLRGHPDTGAALEMFTAGRLDEAALAAVRLQQALPAHFFPLYLVGVIELRRGRVQEALARLTLAAGHVTATAPVFVSLTEAYHADLDKPRARDAFGRALDSLGGDRAALTALVQHALEKGWYTEAEAGCGRLLAGERGDASAWFFLGGALHAQRRFEEAVEAYEQCLRLKPKSADAYLQAAWTQHELGWYVDALETLRQLLEISPDNAAALRESGRMHFHFGQHAGARDAYLAAHRLASPGRAPPRLLNAVRSSLREWCAGHKAGYRCVEPARHTGVPAPRTIPAGEAALWPAYQGGLRERFIARIAGAEVFPQQFAVLSSDGHFFIDDLVTTPDVYPVKGILVKYWNRAGEVLLEAPPRQRIQRGACVLIGGHTNYFHWVYEGVARMMHVEADAALHALPMVLCSGLAPSQIAMLDELGVTPERRLFLAADESLLCDDLVIPSLVTQGHVIPAEVVRFLRDRFSHLVPRNAARRRIYISRNRLGRRALANEAEILPLLAAKGFETAYPEKLSFAEQIALFGAAEAIVAVDGAALVNLFVVPAGAKIGVMAVAGLSTPHYHCVSHHRQHQFTYLHGRLVHDQAKPLDVQDLYLPRARMEQFLQAF